jgi:hypothetical protein
MHDHMVDWWLRCRKPGGTPLVLGFQLGGSLDGLIYVVSEE